MKLKKLILPAVGLLGTAAAVLLHKRPKDVAEVAKAITPETEEMFNGVPLSQLNKLPKEVYHGIRCSVDKSGFLWFHFKSKRGHQTLHTQMYIDEAGKLAGWVHHFPGEIRSSADDFIQKANEVFKFIK